VRSSRFEQLLALAAVFGASLIGSRIIRSHTDRVRVEPLAGGFAILPVPALVLGPAHAPTVRVFGDYACPACRAFEREAGDSLRALASAGLIRIAYYHFPLGDRRSGRIAAAMVVCAAAAGHGWDAYASHYGSTDPPASAHAGRADDASCVNDPRTVQLVDTEREQARSAGVREVPAVFLDDARLRFRSFEDVLRHITRRIEPD